ncbi:MAG TPA: T9SS type A sorting domain-containing protein, partial [Bacteroidales bacterium]|nr:T9SS type A sorting domain-containing protein [Bacteroidales bacterium]
YSSDMGKYIVKHNSEGFATDVYKLSLPGTPISDYRNNIIQSFNDSTIINFSDIGAKMVLIRSDANCNVLWSKYSIVGQISDLVTYNNNVIVVGYDKCASVSKFQIVNISNTGDVVWYKSYNYETIDQKSPIIAKNSRNEFVISESSVYNAASSIRCFIKIDTLGNVLWDRVYHFPNLELITTGFYCYNDMFISVGYLENYEFSEQDKPPYLIIMDNLGNIVSFNIYDYAGAEGHGVWFNDVSGYINTIYLDGRLRSYCYGNSGICSFSLFVKVDISGNVISAISSYTPVFSFSTFGNNRSIMLDDENFLKVGNCYVSVIDTLGNGFCEYTFPEIEKIEITEFYEDFSHDLNVVTSDFSTLTDASVTYSQVFLTDTILCQNQVIVSKSNKSLDNVCVFPNPTNQYVYIHNSNPKSVQILNEIGQVVGEFNDTNKINISYLPKGLYFLKITLINEIQIKKLVIN